VPQLHFYVPEEVAAKIRKQAQDSGQSISRYVADLVKREVHSDWPKHFFEEVVGGWSGDGLVRASQGEYEERDTLEP
jgi:hypothetical protein